MGNKSANGSANMSVTAVQKGKGGSLLFTKLGVSYTMTGSFKIILEAEKMGRMLWTASEITLAQSILYSDLKGIFLRVVKVDE